MWHVYLLPVVARKMLVGNAIAERPRKWYHHPLSNCINFFEVWNGGIMLVSEFLKTADCNDCFKGLTAMNYFCKERKESRIFCSVKCVQEVLRIRPRSGVIKWCTLERRSTHVLFAGGVSLVRITSKLT